MTKLQRMCCSGEWKVSIRKIARGCTRLVYGGLVVLIAIGHAIQVVENLGCIGCTIRWYGITANKGSTVQKRKVPQEGHDPIWSNQKAFPWLKENLIPLVIANTSIVHVGKYWIRTVSGNIR